MPPQNNQYPGIPNNQMGPSQVPQNTMQMPPGQMMPPKKKPNLLIIPVVVLSFALMAALGIAIWAYAGMLDYKNNTQAKIDTAVEIAKKETSTQKDKEFVEKEKVPYRSYKTSDTLASVEFNYPKTWAAYIDESKDTNSGTPLEGYIHPDIVPGTDSGTAYALRAQVVSESYSDVIQQYENKVKQGAVKIVPYKAEKVPSVLGVKIDGEITEGQVNSMVVLPIRDKTLLLWTESATYNNDFNNVVLKSLNFTP